MYDWHRWMPMVCNMATCGPDLLKAVGVGVLFDLACVIVRLG